MTPCCEHPNPDECPNHGSRLLSARPRIVVEWGDIQSQTVDVLPDDLYMPVSEHEALRGAAQAVLRSWDAEPWWAKNTAGTCMHIEDLRAVLASADSEADR